MNENLKILIKWIKDNVERESLFLSPHPQFTVNAHGLLDAIRDIWNLKEGDIESIINKTNKGEHNP